MKSLHKLIHGYIKYLKQSKRGLNEPGAQVISEFKPNYSIEHVDGEEAL